MCISDAKCLGWEVECQTLRVCSGSWECLVCVIECEDLENECMSVCKEVPGWG